MNLGAVDETFPQTTSHKLGPERFNERKRKGVQVGGVPLIDLCIHSLGYFLDLQVYQQTGGFSRKFEPAQIVRKQCVANDFSCDYPNPTVFELRLQ